MGLHARAAQDSGQGSAQSQGRQGRTLSEGTGLAQIAAEPSKSTASQTAADAACDRPQYLPCAGLPRHLSPATLRSGGEIFFSPPPPGKVGPAPLCPTGVARV